MTAPDSPIEAYLDDLVQELSTLRPRELRHLIAETEAHLRDDAEAGLAEGLSWDDAETRAVARFGSAREFARAERDRLRTPLATVLRQTFVSAWLLGAIGAIAVGVSGLIAAAVGSVGGLRTLVDVTAGQTLTASECARRLAADPGASNCRAAAVSDWAAEIVWYRIAVGVLGLIALIGYFWFRRVVASTTVLPTLVTDTIATTLFAAAAVGSFGFGLDAVVTASGHGSGQWFSATPVALAAAVGFGARLVRDLRAPGEDRLIAVPS